MRFVQRGITTAVLAAGMAIAADAAQATLVLTGNFLQVGISDNGTFGSGNGTPPGILHDPTGTGNFAPGGIPNDYLTPGSPHDGFAVRSAQTGFIINDNQGPSDFGSALPTLTSVAGFSNAATWSSGNGSINVTNTYFFNPGDSIIHIITRLTALTDLTGLSFGRSEDPDPDVNAFGTFQTNNSRGNSTLAASELVSSAGERSGLILGILNENGNVFPHNTGISSFCCNNDDPVNVLAGYGPIFPVTNLGDFGMQMAWDIGDLAADSSVEIRYAYVFGENRGTLPGGVPEPGSIALLGLGLAGLGAMRRRKAK